MIWLRWGVAAAIVAGMSALLIEEHFRPLKCEAAIDRYGWQQAVIMGACDR